MNLGMFQIRAMELPQILEFLTKKSTNPIILYRRKIRDCGVKFSSSDQTKFAKMNVSIHFWERLFSSAWNVKL